MKNELIKIEVEMEIRYDETRKGAREDIVNTCVTDVPIEMCGASTITGCYSAKRTGNSRLVEH